MSWLLELEPDVFEDIPHENMTVHQSGAIQFYNGTLFAPRDRVVRAPGRWISVCEDSE